MKRAAAVMAVVAILSPAAVLIASACSATPCCAGGEERFTQAMPCCQPSLCAAASPAPQPKAVETVAAAPDALVTSPTVVDQIPIHGEHFDEAERPPAPTRIRLALIATLLI